jgi:hypothetical protein
VDATARSIVEESVPRFARRLVAERPTSIPAKADLASVRLLLHNANTPLVDRTRDSAEERIPSPKFVREPSDAEEEEDKRTDEEEGDVPRRPGSRSLSPLSHTGDMDVFDRLPTVAALTRVLVERQGVTSFRTGPRETVVSRTRASVVLAAERAARATALHTPVRAGVFGGIGDGGGGGGGAGAVSRLERLLSARRGGGSAAFPGTVAWERAAVQDPLRASRERGGRPWWAAASFAAASPLEAVLDRDLGVDAHPAVAAHVPVRPDTAPLPGRSAGRPFTPRLRRDVEE